MKLGAFILTAVEEAHGAEAAQAGSAGLPQFDPSSWPSQLFWLALTFGVLYWMMAGYFLPHLGRTIAERRDRIADDLDKAAEGRAKASDAEKAYNQALADATAKTQAIAAETRAKLAAQLSELSAAADAEAAKNLAGAEARIAAMKADASKKVREAALDASRAIVAKLLDETPTPETAAAAAAAL
jgi:F-type H+-transporting ATPase subunit b